MPIAAYTMGNFPVFFIVNLTGTGQDRGIKVALLVIVFHSFFNRILGCLGQFFAGINVVFFFKCRI